MLKLNERYLTFLVFLAIIGIIFYPIRHVEGVVYFVIVSLCTLLQTEVRQLFFKRVLPFLPALVIFGLLPFFISVLTGDHESVNAELLFGAGIFGKAFTILILLTFLVSNVSFSHLFRIMNDWHVPLRAIFLMMVAYRFLAVFIQEIRSLMQARMLRLFGRSALRSISGTLNLMVHKAMDYAESIYIAMRVRGGESAIPLLARYHSHRYDMVILAIGVVVVLLPYFGLLVSAGYL